MRQFNTVLKRVFHGFDLLCALATLAAYVREARAEEKLQRKSAAYAFACPLSCSK